MLKNMIFSGEDPVIIFDDRACEGLYYLENLSFPEKCYKIEIGKSAFGNCGLNKLVLPEGTKTVGSYAFQKNSKLESVVINDSPKIGEDAFLKCNKLSEIVINGSPELSPNSFENCTALTNIDIDTTNNIEGSAFNGCINLSTINGKEILNKDGSPKDEYKDFIEKSFSNADNNGIVNQYVMYRVKQTLAETIDDSMSDVQKIKAIHDKICSMVDYDTNDTSDIKNHTDVSIFLNDTSVCEGYARAMNLMLREAGLESWYVRTPGHAWVIVKAGNHNFHVDATWDDDGDTVSYEWFMKSDAQIYGKDNHTGWVTEIPSELHKFQKKDMPVCTSIMGDVNEDGVADGRDASEILSYYAKLSVEGTADIDTVLADFNFDGKINAVDASLVLTDYADASAEGSDQQA